MGGVWRVSRIRFVFDIPGGLRILGRDFYLCYRFFYMNMFLIWYALLTGAVLSVNHIGMKLMKGNLHTSLFYGFLLCAVINLILAYTQQEKILSMDIRSNLWGILLFALGNGIMIYLVVR